MEAQAAFDAVNASYSVINSNPDEPRAYPRVVMTTKTYVPFFILIDYQWEREAEVGGGASNWFSCFFGKIIMRAETDRWVT
jgi:hypothetical protein